MYVYASLVFPINAEKEKRNNSTVVNTVSEYYNLARTDSGFPLTFLHCDGWKNKDRHNPQTDCRTYSDNGKLSSSQGRNW